MSPDQCPWSPPARKARIVAQASGNGEVEVARVLGRWHSCDVHVQVPGSTWDGAVVNLYAIAGPIMSLVASQTIGAATLQTTLDAAGGVVGRQGLIVSAGPHGCEGFRVTVEPGGADLSSATFVTEAWGQ
jgi:hypothetical protein